MRYITCGCAMVNADIFYTFSPRLFHRKKVPLTSVILPLMTLYQYHSLAVYRKNVHDMKSHNIQEITFSCHTKSTKKFPYFFFGRYFFGKKHACGTTIICIQEQEPKENKATSKRLITEA